MINDMKKLLFLFSVIALAACGDSDDGVNTPPDVPSPRLLTVVVGENPMQDESAPSREMTRTAAATTTASLSNFYMNYQINKYTFSNEGTGWNTIPWPTGDEKDTKIDFYAYNYDTVYGTAFQWNGGNPYVVFKMDNDPFEQKDFLVAKHENISYNDNGGKVSLTFDHACAAVQFYVYKEVDTDYTVNSIILKGMKNQANYSYSAGWGTPGYSTDWADETKRYYTLTESDITVTTEMKLLPCKWLFFIPQAKDGIQIVINYNTDRQKILTLSSGTWEAGKKYTVNIRIGKARTS